MILHTLYKYRTLKSWAYIPPVPGNQCIGTIADEHLYSLFVVGTSRHSMLNGRPQSYVITAGTHTHRESKSRHKTDFICRKEKSILATVFAEYTYVQHIPKLNYEMKDICCNCRHTQFSICHCPKCTVLYMTVHVNLS